MLSTYFRDDLSTATQEWGVEFEFKLAILESGAAFRMFFRGPLRVRVTEVDKVRFGGEI
jgi:hypothetical protein